MIFMRIHNIPNKIWDGIYKEAKMSLLGTVIFTNLGYNGCLDSERTRTTGTPNERDNVIKTVEGVAEDLNPGYNSSTWINPQVTREIVFNDGSQRTLQYRTRSWQPFRRWIFGEEFNPQPGEHYEVTKDNTFVRKVE